jgi:RNA polymerase sigma factor (sigma-70 family)
LDDSHPETWELLLRHRHVAMADLLGKTGSVVAAEDCVQEALLRLGGRASLDPDLARALLVRTARGVDREHRRRAAREQSVLVQLAGMAVAEVVSPEEIAAQREEAARARAALEQLPRREGQALRLQLAGLTVAEIARRLGISYKSVEGALTRARARLRLILGGVVAWVAERLRRAGSSRGEAAATTVAALLLLLPSLHPRLDVHQRHEGIATAPPRLAAASEAPGSSPRVAPARPSLHDGPSPPGQPPRTRGRVPRQPSLDDPPIVDTGPIDILGLVQWGVHVHGTLDPTDYLRPSAWVNCLAHANPSPSTGGLC